MKKQILFYRYNSICEPPVMRAFTSLGCHIEEITEEISNKNVTPAECIKIISNRLYSKSYDAVFSINFYPAISEVCNIFKVPYVCLSVDCPIMELYSDSIKNPFNRIFLFDYAQYQEFYPKNPDCIFYLPLAADVAQYDSIINTINPVADRRFISDISFIGSLYSEKCSYNKAANLPDYLRGYLEGIMNAQLRIYGYNLLTDVVTNELALEYGRYGQLYHFPEKSEHNYKAALAHNVLGYKIAELERKKLLGILSDRFSVDLYTASDTSQLPNIHNKGTVASLTEMPKIFHLSKINLNFTIKPIQTGLPLRIWDIMGCGGFVLTNYQEEIAEYFEIGKEIEIFGSETELLEKCEYYLSHDDERAQIAQNGYNKVKEFHTWIHRCDKMLSIVPNA